MDATWNRGGWIVLLACVCLDYRTLFLSCVSTSPGPMCLSSRARALGDGCRVARWRGVMPSKSFCRQLARLDSSNFRKRTLPCKHTARVNRADGNFRNQPFFSTVVMNQQRCHAHSHTHTHRAFSVVSASIRRSSISVPFLLPRYWVLVMSC